VFTALSADGDVEILQADLSRGTSVRFSADPRDDFTPVWTHDGRAVIWTALQPARGPILVMHAADGTGRAEEVLPETSGAQFTGSVSPSGVLAYTLANGETAATDIWVVPLSGPRVPRALVATSASEFGPEFSPDGNWIAYVSDESGAYEIYVVPYPGPGGKRQITKGGGVSPAWRRDGGELFYQTAAGLMAMEVTPGPLVQFGSPHLLLAGQYFIDSRPDGPRAYDVAPGGTRFLMVQIEAVAESGPALHVMMDWASR
jgi:Tol biopolymer transport system component